MSKNTQTATIGKKSASMTTKTLTYSALLAALSVALSRLVGMMPAEFSRYSLEAIPTILAGILFGPVAGGMVGFVYDFVGCLFSPYPYNPLFCVPPILYGVVGGLFRYFLAKKVSLPRLLLTVAPAAILGSMLWQSWALSFVYGKGFLLMLSTRAVQFTIMIVVDAVIIDLLFKTKLFQRLGVWPPRGKKAEAAEKTEL